MRDTVVGAVTTLAIVDDHEALRDGLAALLATRGCEVLGTAGSVVAGVDLVEHTNPDVLPELLTKDIVLSGLAKDTK